MEHAVEQWRWNRKRFSVGAGKLLLFERVEIVADQPADVVAVFECLLAVSDLLHCVFGREPGGLGEFLVSSSGHVVDEWSIDRRSGLGKEQTKQLRWRIETK